MNLTLLPTNSPNRSQAFFLPGGSRNLNESTGLKPPTYLFVENKGGSERHLTKKEKTSRKSD
jgi:hypothetical protein